MRPTWLLWARGPSKDEQAQKDGGEESLHPGLGSGCSERSFRIEKLENLTALFDVRVCCVGVFGLELKAGKRERSFLSSVMGRSR